MKTAKDFDCVAMKNEIQQRLIRECAELGEEDAQNRREERLRRDPILGEFLLKKRATGQPRSELQPK